MADEGKKTSDIQLEKVPTKLSKDTLRQIRIAEKTFKRLGLGRHTKQMAKLSSAADLLRKQSDALRRIAAPISEFLPPTAFHTPAVPEIQFPTFLMEDEILKNIGRILPPSRSFETAFGRPMDAVLAEYNYAGRILEEQTKCLKTVHQFQEALGPQYSQLNTVTNSLGSIRNCHAPWEKLIEWLAHPIGLIQPLDGTVRDAAATMLLQANPPARTDFGISRSLQPLPAPTVYQSPTSPRLHSGLGDTTWNSGAGDPARARDYLLKHLILTLGLSDRETQELVDSIGAENLRDIIVRRITSTSASSNSLDYVSSRPVFTDCGDGYEVSFGGQSRLIRKSKGLKYLEILIGNPGVNIPVLELRNISEGRGPGAETSLAVLDDGKTDLRDMKARLDEVKAELENATVAGDYERKALLTRDKELLLESISSCLDRRRRLAEDNPELERLRKAVAAAISRTLVSLAPCANIYETLGPFGISVGGQEES